MLFVVPDEIRGKFHYSENYGGYLDEPYTAEEKRICNTNARSRKRIYYYRRMNTTGQINNGDIKRKRRENERF